MESIIQYGVYFQFKNLCNTIGAASVTKGIVTNPNPVNHQTLYFPLQQEDENKVRQILWNLIVERVITIGDYHNDTWPWLSITERGKDILLNLEQYNFKQNY